MYIATLCITQIKAKSEIEILSKNQDRGFHLDDIEQAVFKGYGNSNKKAKSDYTFETLSPGYDESKWRILLPIFHKVTTVET